MKQKIIIVFLCVSLGFLAFGASVFAASDCSMVKTTLVGNEFTKQSVLGTFGDMYPIDAFNQALKNLKAYCCQSNAFGSQTSSICEVDKDYFVEYYPESPYLYDHLVDVALRRLDGVGAYGLDADVRGLEWRTYISKEMGESADPGFALAMEEKFKKYWTVSDENAKYVPVFASWVEKMDARAIAELAIKYQNANLYHRYTETCGIAAQLYFTYADQMHTDENSLIKSSGFGFCENMVQERISDEILYAKALMSQKSTLLLHKSVEAYLTNYFAKNRLINLQETVVSISDLFLTIAQMIPEGTRQCH